jgi:hypothetical protein
MRVLICDGLRQQGVKIFQKVKNLEVEVREKIEPEEFVRRSGGKLLSEHPVCA